MENHQDANHQDANQQDARAEFARKYQTSQAQETSALNGAVKYTRELGGSFKFGVKVGLVVLGFNGAIYGVAALGRAISKLGD